MCSLIANLTKMCSFPCDNFFLTWTFPPPSLNLYPPMVIYQRNPYHFFIMFMWKNGKDFFGKLQWVGTSLVGANKEKMFVKKTNCHVLRGAFVKMKFVVFHTIRWLLEKHVYLILGNYFIFFQNLDSRIFRVIDTRCWHLFCFDFMQTSTNKL